MMQQSFNMEQANFMTQTMQDTMVQVRAMKGANEAMKANFKEINLDDIEVRETRQYERLLPRCCLVLLDFTMLYLCIQLSRTCKTIWRML